MPRTKPVKFPLPPMEARLVATLPEGEGWQYEPKWDGFRCLVFRKGNKVVLQSKSGKPLGRYFPEVLEAMGRVSAREFVLDGEIVVPGGEGSDFSQLLQRIHPAASRVKKLAESNPAQFMAFDLLSDERGISLLERALAERRPRLEAFLKSFVPRGSLVRLSPATTRAAEARQWLEERRGFVDGIVAKRLEMPYAAGRRTAMEKFKPIRTADCVVGGFRYGSNSREVGSLLLGLYEDGLLHHVGFASNIPAADRAALTAKLRRLVKPPGFTGRAPGGPSRWSTERSGQWEPLRPELVVEVSFDHVTDKRFRHGTKLLRWRPDKEARQCTMEQLLPAAAARAERSRKPARGRPSASGPTRKFSPRRSGGAEKTRGGGERCGAGGGVSRHSPA